MLGTPLGLDVPLCVCMCVTENKRQRKTEGQGKREREKERGLSKRIRERNVCAQSRAKARE